METGQICGKDMAVPWGREWEEKLYPGGGWLAETEARHTEGRDLSEPGVGVRSMLWQIRWHPRLPNSNP